MNRSRHHWWRERDRSEHSESPEGVTVTKDGKVLSEPQKRTGVKYAQFSLVGGSNALIDVGIFARLVLVFPTSSPEVLVVYNVGALANANSYLWNTLWTFRSQADHDARQVGLFTGQAILNAAMGGLLLWLAAHWLASHTGLSPLIEGNVAKVFSMLVASTMSFLAAPLLRLPARGGLTHSLPTKLTPFRPKAYTFRADRTS